MIIFILFYCWSCSRDGAGGRIEVAQQVEFQSRGHDDKEGVDDKEENADPSIQDPFVEVEHGDGGNDGEEEEEDGVRQSRGLDRGIGSGMDDRRLQEPGDGQSDQDVKDIGSDGITDRHVRLSGTSDMDGGVSIRDGGTGCQQRDPHHRVRDPERES